MIMGKGDLFYHPAIYEGGGRVLESAGSKDGVARKNLWSKFPKDYRAYRPPAKDAAQGVRNMRKGVKAGIEYKNESKELLRHAAKHWAGIPEKTGGNLCRAGKNGLVCTEAVTEAMPGIFKNRLASPLDMRGAKGLELVARHSPIAPPTPKELLMSRGVYPLIRNAKWGLLAGLGVGAYSMMNRGNDYDERA